jgi:ParB-like chromosome segregation protein Spo0J
MMEYADISDLKIAPWETTCYVVSPDYKRLVSSINTYGLLSPILVQKNLTIIDGYHRLTALKELSIKSAPIRVVDCDDIEAILLHIDLNRYRGIVVAKFLSNLIRHVLDSSDYDEDSLRDRMAMTKEEFEILADGTLIKMRKIKQHSYSPAWVPIESNSGDDFQIEKVTGHKEQV